MPMSGMTTCLQFSYGVGFGFHPYQLSHLVFQGIKREPEMVLFIVEMAHLQIHLFALRLNALQGQTPMLLRLRISRRRRHHVQFRHGFSRPYLPGHPVSQLSQPAYLHLDQLCMLVLNLGHAHRNFHLYPGRNPSGARGTRRVTSCRVPFIIGFTRHRQLSRHLRLVTFFSPGSCVHHLVTAYPV